MKTEKNLGQRLLSSGYSLICIACAAGIEPGREGGRRENKGSSRIVPMNDKENFLLPATTATAACLTPADVDATAVE